MSKDDNESLIFTPDGIKVYKVADTPDDEKPKGFFKRITEKIKSWFHSEKKDNANTLLKSLPPELREAGKAVLKKHPEFLSAEKRKVELNGALDIIEFLFQQAGLDGTRENDKFILRFSENEDSKVRIKAIAVDRGPETVISVVPVFEEGLVIFNEDKMRAITECALRLSDRMPYMSLRADYPHARIVFDIPIFTAGLAALIKSGRLMMAAHYLMSRMFIASLATTYITNALLRVDEGEDAEYVALQERPKIIRQLKEDTKDMKFFAFEPSDD